MSELFANFEVNKQPRWPIISKLLEGSTLMHVSLAVCVLYIPGLRSAFNIASLIAGTRYVDRPYEKTQIGDDVQLVEIASDKFHYPEGYFAPEGQFPVTPPPAAPSFVAQAQPTGVMPEALVSMAASPTPILPIAPSSSPSPTPGATASPSQAIAQAKGIPSPVQSPGLTADQAQ